MRCKKHVPDLSSAVGVCASCLRERLLTIIAAQVQKQQLAAAAKPNPKAAHHHDSPISDGHQQPLPILFPRSASPYISPRRPDKLLQRFYSTPLVGPTGAVETSNSHNKKDKKKKKNRSRFIKQFFGMFRSQSDKMDRNRDPEPGPSYCHRGDISGASPAWFRKKQLHSFSPVDSRRPQPPRRRYLRGMSPARYFDEEEEDGGRGSSGYSSESSQGWRQTPRRTTTPAMEVRRRGLGRGLGLGLGHGKNVSSGLAFCLSPLVRASPSRNRNRNQKGVPPEMVVAGESRTVAPTNKLSGSASFCKNRSRKLADYGRYSYNYNTRNN